MPDSRPHRLRTLVVDDEALARRNLIVLLERDRDVVSIAECASGMEAVEAIRRSAYDLVFLDVQMPECDGFACSRCSAATCHGDRLRDAYQGMRCARSRPTWTTC
jgi:CheY-like chemotaxis protein